MAQIKKQKARRLENVLSTLKWQFNHIPSGQKAKSTLSIKDGFNATLAQHQRQTVAVMMEQIERQLLNVTRPTLAMA